MLRDSLSFNSAYTFLKLHPSKKKRKKIKSEMVVFSKIRGSITRPFYMGVPHGILRSLVRMQSSFHIVEMSFEH